MYKRLNSSEQDILTLMGIGEFLPSNWLVDCLSSLFCHEGDVTQGVCTSIRFVLCGYDATQLNNTLLPDILHHTPAGASTHTILQRHRMGTIPAAHVCQPVVGILPRVLTVHAPLVIMYSNS